MSTKDLIELKPIRETKSDYDQIEAKIKELFLKEIYRPIIKEFTPAKVLRNSRNDLIEAIRSGRITFNRGKFSGRLNANLSKELRALGAKWSRTEECYFISQANLPVEIRNVISTSAFKFQEKINKVDQRLAAIVPEELASKLNLTNLFDQSIWKVEKQFRESVKNISVAPEFTSQRMKDLSKAWQKNMDLWIKDFTAKEIKKLRVDLSRSVFAGNRYEHAISSIQKSYGVSQNKAKFLARQETALGMTTYKYSRYQEVGVSEYKWRSVVGTPSHPVRARHKALNDASAKGEIFTFNNPPVTSDAGEPARRNNPGQDYNCRCVAIPVVRFNT